MSDSFTETTSTGWFSKIGNAFWMVLLSPLVMAGSAALLFWNEGEYLYRQVSLDEAKKAQVDVPDSSKLEADKMGKLVHLTGDAKSDETLEDPEFGLKVKAIHLYRAVEMYQWVEKEKKEEQKKLGGGTETKTVYSYDKKWEGRPIDSGDFKNKQGHENPGAFPIQSKSETVKKVAVGAYHLSSKLIGEIDKKEPLTLDAEAVETSPWLKDRKDVQVSTSEVYLGDAASGPKVGDVRITFKQVLPAQVSVLAALGADGLLAAWKASNGYEIERLMYGAESGDEMIKVMKAESETMLWLLRAVGAVLMVVGVGMVFKPLEVLADVIPMLGDFIGWGTGLFAFVIGAAMSLFVVGVAWFYYRPLYGVLLFVAGVALIMTVRMLFAKPRPKIEPFPA